MAAGRGQRMGSERPKVLCEAAGRPMIHWVVSACQKAGVSRCIVVIGHGGDEVKAALADDGGCTFVTQHEQKGTGHAAQMAEPAFAGAEPTDVFVLAGDAPLVRPSTLQALLRTHREQEADATLASSMLKDPAGYGRIVRDPMGRFQRIVEHKDASEAELRINEINPSYYCFRSDLLFETLSHVKDANSQHEYYLTDVPELLISAGKQVAVVDAVPPEDVLGVNTPEQLAVVDRILRTRLAELSYNQAC